MRAAIRKLDWTDLPIVAAFALSVALAPAFRAQDQGSITKVTPVPDGAYFNVDGASYQHAVGNIWPAGSKHILSVLTPQNPPNATKTLLTFDHWEFSGGTATMNPLTVTATPAIPEYRAIFSQQVALTIVFFNCPDPSHCSAPGNILVNNEPINTSADLFFAP